MKASECMCNNVCAIKPNLTINEVAKLMGEKHIGCIPVCDDENCICGIVTDRDLVLRGMACGKNIDTTKVSDIMTCNPCTCKEDDDIEKAEDLMAENQIKRIPVCDNNNNIVGMLSIGNLFQNHEDLDEDELCYTLECICKNSNKNA